MAGPRTTRLARWIGTAALVIAGGNAWAEPAPEQRLPEVRVVDATDALEERRRAPAAAIVLGREEIEKFDDATVGEVLRRLPGVTYSGPPGVTKERQIQVDRLPADMIERIELIHNPTAAQDAEGIGGTVNIVLRKAAAQRVVRFRVGGGRTGPAEIGEAGVQYGNRSGGFSYLLNLGVIDRAERLTDTKVGFQANATVKDSLVESKPADVKELTFSPRLRWEREGGGSFSLDPFLIVSGEDKRKDQFKFNAAGAANGSQDETEDKKRVIARLRGGWEQRLAGGQKLNLRFTAQQGTEDKDKRRLDYNPAGVLTKTTLESEKQDEREWAARAALDGVAIKRHLWSVGLEGVLKNWETDKQLIENGAARPPAAADRFQLRERKIVAYAQDEVQVDPANVLTPGLRLERIRRESEDGAGAARTGTTSAFNPSIHYLHRWNAATNLRASVARTLRLPKFEDLAPGLDVKGGTLANPDKGGNPDLRPERAIGYELGVERFLRASDGVAGLNFFYRDVSDLIERQAASEGGRFVSRPFNVGGARVWGAEFDFKSRMGAIGLPGLTLTLNYARLFSEVEEAAGGDDRRIKDQPPYVVNVGFDHEVRRGGPSFGALYNYLPAFTSRSTKEDGNTELKFESAKKLLDLYAAYPLDRGLRLRLAVRNVLQDDKFRDSTVFNANGSFNSRETRLEESSRTWFVSLEGKW